MKTIILVTAILASTTGFAQTKPQTKKQAPNRSFSLLTEEERNKPLSEMSAKEYLR